MQKYKIRKIEEEEFEYTGTEIYKHEDGSIRQSQRNYANLIDTDGPISSMKEDKERELTNQEKARKLWEL